ncbi:hypothetical protein TWF694_005439 [Orbilia ellipsospora]|uniref:Uncharacterized protein n=1 Tax=Orbilia ellipsospora TaxID=2528407 RepID=A0AAV9WU61_9PEZI
MSVPPWPLYGNQYHYSQYPSHQPQLQDSHYGQPPYQPSACQPSQLQGQGMTTDIQRSRSYQNDSRQAVRRPGNQVTQFQQPINVPMVWDDHYYYPRPEQPTTGYTQRSNSQAQGQGHTVRPRRSLILVPCRNRRQNNKRTTDHSDGWGTSGPTGSSDGGEEEDQYQDGYIRDHPSYAQCDNTRHSHGSRMQSSHETSTTPQDSGHGYADNNSNNLRYYPGGPLLPLGAYYDFPPASNPQNALRNQQSNFNPPYYGY